MRRRPDSKTRYQPARYGPRWAELSSASFHQLLLAHRGSIPILARSLSTLQTVRYRTAWSSRGAACVAPPSRIRTCGFPASGSCRGCNVQVHVRATTPVTGCFRHCVRCLLCRSAFPRLAPFPPRTPRRLYVDLFAASSVSGRRRRT